MDDKVTQKKRIAIIGTVGVPANYGGFETLAEHLIEDLSNNYEITVFCSGKKYPKEIRSQTYKGASLKYIPLEANGIQSILYDAVSIIQALFFADVLLILGVAGAWTLPFVKILTKVKIIISIDGIEWKREKWNLLARWYLFWAESLAVKYSHIDISDNEAIQDYTSERYGSLSRIIEYGADHTMKVAINEIEAKVYPFLNQPYAVKVCRIEPENNIHLVLEAFATTKTMPLVIIGNWEKSDYGKALKSKYGTLENIYLLNPIYNQRKLDLIRGNAKLYVHGHSAGGTNPSLVEAMYLGLPVIAYGVSYNRVTTEHKAIYFINLSDLIDKLNETKFADLETLGVEMNRIATRRYCWKQIIFKYQLLFEEALETSAKIKVEAETKKISYEKLLELGQAHLKTNFNY